MNLAFRFTVSLSVTTSPYVPMLSVARGLRPLPSPQIYIVGGVWGGAFFSNFPKIKMCDSHFKNVRIIHVACEKYEV